MRLGLGPGSGEIHTLLAEAGQLVAAVTREVEQRFLQGSIAVGSTEIQHISGFAAQNGVHADL